MHTIRSSGHRSSTRILIRVALCGLGVGTALGTFAADRAAARAGSARTALAVTYAEGHSTSVDLVGSALKPGTLGRADVKRQEGRTRIKLHLNALPHPQSFGAFYTTYLLWAVAPEGQAENLAELPDKKDVDLEVTTALPTFALIVTAEPHAAVSLPSPLVVAENSARENTEGTLQTGRLRYGGAVSDLYDASDPADASRRDFVTPPMVLGARHAVELARHAGAGQYAATEMTTVEARLAELERAVPKGGKLSPAAEALAREVMRTAEHARRVATERGDQARLSAERAAAGASVAQAQSDAERARAASQQAQAQADAARTQADSARAQADVARADAALARAGEQDARTQTAAALAAKAEAETALQQQQQQLYEQLTTIIETRREARGLIVSLSDVLFETGSANLTPGAREKLAKLAGVMATFPGSYTLLTEGHTDSMGSELVNERLSRARAESVLAYLVQAGVPRTHVSSATGYGESRPVASNDTSSGRQMNRRVEIVITGLES